MYSGELTDYALKSGNRCERHSRRRASLRFVSLSAYKGRTWKGKRPAPTIRGRVTLASTARSGGGGSEEEEEEGEEGEYKVHVHRTCVWLLYPVPHRARCGAAHIFQFVAFVTAIYSPVRVTLP